MSFHVLKVAQNPFFEPGGMNASIYLSSKLFQPVTIQIRQVCKFEDRCNFIVFAEMQCHGLLHVHQVLWVILLHLLCYTKQYDTASDAGHLVQLSLLHLT